ncbi:MAG TPA: tetratricopeptide repeat protein [Gemmatimonadales bacterium]|jgi:tetratricopeptide (TPR) repeat protein
MAYQREVEKLEQRFNEKPEQWFAALADAYRKNGDLDLAIDVLQAWIPKRPSYTSGHIVLGRCFLDKEQDTEAEQTFRQVIELDPENIIALKSLAEIAARRNVTAEARDWLTRLLEADPMNDEARVALAALPAGDAPEAAPVAEEAAGGFGLGIDLGEEPATEAVAAEQQVAGFEATTHEPELEMPPVDIGDLAPEPEPAGPPAGMAEEATMMMGGAPAEPFAPPEEEPAAAAPAGEPDIPFDAPTVIEGLSISQIPTQPMEPVEGSTGEEATVTEMAAFTFETEEPPPDVAPAEGFVQVDGAAVEPAEPVSKQSFDEDLDWDEGDRTSKQVTQADVAEAERQHAEGFVTVDGASEEAGEALEVENYETAIEMTEGEAPAPVGAGDVFQDDSFGADSLEVMGDVDEELVGDAAGYDDDATVRTDASALVAATAAHEQSLDLIMPDDAAADMTTREPDAGDIDLPLEGGHDAPVLTQTMAEVYLRQGHVAQAREILERLLARDPSDDGIRAKLAQLDAPAAAPAPGGAAATRAARFSVAVTGGVSARDMLARMAGTEARVPRARPSVRPAQSRSSFDAFFGEASSPPAPAPVTEADAEDPDKGGGGDGGDFTDWLKGLKT